MIIIDQLRCSVHWDRQQKTNRIIGTNHGALAALMSTNSRYALTYKLFCNKLEWGYKHANEFSN